MATYVRREQQYLFILNIYVHLFGDASKPRLKEREISTLFWRFPMSTVQLMGLVRTQKEAARKAKEKEYHQHNDFAKHNWITEDKTGKCYVYRGNKYCY